MIDHVTLRVSNFERSTSFYDRAFAPLGLQRLFDDMTGTVRASGYGDCRPWFWVTEDDRTRGYVHIAIRAGNREAVDAFYDEALSAGGRDNGAPGLRPHYHPGYYGAFVIDPDGHNIEAVFHDRS